MTQRTLLSDTLATFAVNTNIDATPAAVRDWAKLLILDAVGNAYASSRFDFARQALTAMLGLDSGASTVIGMPGRLTLRDAVLMNGMLVHGLDYDDTYLPGAAHLTASCVPTTLGVAAHLDASGADLLAACLIGVESGIRLAAVAKGSFLKTGFHPTSLCGAFGSVIGAGRLMKLTHEQMMMAQGLVLSSASGNMQPTQEGAWAKRLHPGLMGSAAITAASLARQGFTGPHEVYEGRYGLFPCFLGVHAGDADLSLATQRLGAHWECARTSIKLYPACYQSHAAMNAAVELREQEAVDVTQIESIHARMAEAAVALVCEPLAAKKKPHNSYAAQFSLPYALACCLARGRFALEETAEASYSDPLLLDLADKVSYEIDPDSGFPKFRSGEVIVRLKDGRVVSRRKNVLPDEPASAAQIIAKFRQNTQYALTPAKAGQVTEMILNLEKLGSAKTLSELISGDNS